MKPFHKVGLGFVAAGFVVGVLTPILGLQGFKTPILITLGALCGLTIFVMVLRARKPPKSD